MSTPVPDPSPDSVDKGSTSWVRKALRIEWLGQMGASLFWICSVLTYGISSTGDVLQMLAAVSWFVANLAALAPAAGRSAAG